MLKLVFILFDETTYSNQARTGENLALNCPWSISIVQPQGVIPEESRCQKMAILLY
jgi:hypothetical protein